MSTRSAVRIMVEPWPGQPAEKLVDLYRHYDGYPAGSGVTIAETVATIDGKMQVRFGDEKPGYKTRADALVGELLKTGEYEITPDAENHGDLEWFYVVTFRNYDATLGGSHAGSRATAPVVGVEVYERNGWNDNDEPLGWPKQTYDLETFTAYVKAEEAEMEKRYQALKAKGVVI